MIDEASLEAISGIVGPDHVLLEDAAKEEYGTDATKLTFMPDAVVFPVNTEQVSRLLSLASQNNIPVTPRGAGSGMSGGALPVSGGLVMAMDRFNSILMIDEENLIAKVEPGVITGKLQEAVERRGLFYPPDPASLNISTIGGNIAECAGGLRAVKYGVTRDYVLGLNTVLPTGEILNTGVETMKGVAGYDLTRLIIGSEGTLAVITSATLRLIPKPRTKRTMIAFFRDTKASVETVSNIIRSKIVPAILEFIDRRCIECVQEEIDIPVPSNAGAMLLVEVDGERAGVDESTGVIRDICLNGNAIRFIEASSEHEAEELWELRRNISPALYRLRPHKISEDVVVPRNRMPDLITSLDELGLKYGLPVPAFGHAGDGNIHVNIMFDRDKKGEEEKARLLIKEMLAQVLQMKGTITGEHGIGITKAPYYPMEVSQTGAELMGRIKKAFDPKGILNPGKIFT